MLFYQKGGVMGAWAARTNGTGGEQKCGPRIDEKPEPSKRHRGNDKRKYATKLCRHEGLEQGGTRRHRKTDDSYACRKTKRETDDRNSHYGVDTRQVLRKTEWQETQSRYKLSQQQNTTIHDRSSGVQLGSRSCSRSQQQGGDSTIPWIIDRTPKEEQLLQYNSLETARVDRDGILNDAKAIKAEEVLFPKI